MTSRATRIERLRHIRQRELSQLTGQLNASRARRDAAQTDATSAATRLEEARNRQRSLLESGGHGHDFARAEEWVYQKELQLEIAFNAVRRAEREVERCAQEVRIAHRRLEQIKLLSARLDARTREEQRKTERRQEDEVASRSSRRGAR